MIVQSAPAQSPRLVIAMAQHTALAGKFARAFGNSDFAAIAPRDEMLFATDHHDYGWMALDAEPARNPQTGLPWHLTDTPHDLSVQTLGPAIPMNEAHHPYCALLVAMHLWGIYNGRYGLSDQVLLDGIAPQYRPSFDEKMAQLQAHQDRLKRSLASQSETAAWVEDEHLFQNYKQLQFFDLLALYFNCTHPADRQSQEFRHVPKSATEAVTVRVVPAGGDRYVFEPFPFQRSSVTVSFEGRYLTPMARTDAELLEVWKSTPTSTQTVQLMSAS